MATSTAIQQNNTTEINPSVAHITAEDGAIFQVLNEEGTDWDEAATKAVYDQYIANNE